MLRKQDSESKKSGEMDFMENSLLALWRQKWLIVCTIFLSVALASSYIWLAKPAYEAKFYLLPPFEDGVMGINGLKSIDETVNYVYQIFIGSLASHATKEAFFDQVFLPVLPANHRNTVSQTKLRKQLDGIIALKQDFGNPARYTLRMRSKSSLQAADWVVRYVDLARDNAVNRILHDTSVRVKVLANDLDLAMDRVRTDGKQARLDRLAQLKEALNTAQAIGLTDPKYFKNSLSEKSNMIFLRGTKMLTAEIKGLEMRQSDDPFLPKLRTLQKKYDNYQFILQYTKGLADHLTVYRADGRVDVSVVTPRKQLIIMLSLVLGGLLGVAVAFGRSFVLLSGRNQAVV